MLGPGIGGFEIVVIALVALIVVGPKDLPLLMRKVGQFVGRARKMAAEFRASFDDMARQSELDDLRREVEALRTGQMDVIGKETSATFKAIDKELKAPVLPKPVAKSVTQTPPLTEPSIDAATREAIVARKLAEAATPVPAPEAPVGSEAPARAPRRKAATPPADAAKPARSRRKAADA